MTTDPQRRLVRTAASCTREQVGDYLLCRNAAGAEGWVPEACAHETMGGS